AARTPPRWRRRPPRRGPPLPPAPPPRPPPPRPTAQRRPLGEPLHVRQQREVPPARLHLAQHGVRLQVPPPQRLPCHRLR
ncbi:triacylglycerol lipase, partial [Streptomyces tateyamensis]